MLIVDAGPLVASADRNDRHHAVCRELLEIDPGPLVTTAMVIAETVYMVIARSVRMPKQRSTTPSSTAPSTSRTSPKPIGGASANSSTATRSCPLGGSDASLVASAERVGASRIATLNYRDFRVVRPAPVDAFDLVPPSP